MGAWPGVREGMESTAHTLTRGPLTGVLSHQAQAQAWSLRISRATLGACCPEPSKQSSTKSVQRLSVLEFHLCEALP